MRFFVHSSAARGRRWLKLQSNEFGPRWGLNAMFHPNWSTGSGWMGEDTGQNNRQTNTSTDNKGRLDLSGDARTNIPNARTRTWMHPSPPLTHTQPFYDSLDFVRQDNTSQPVPEETFTHSHLSWSSMTPYLLPPSITWHPPCSIYVPDSLCPQSLSKFSLVYLLAWHPPFHSSHSLVTHNHVL